MGKYRFKSYKEAYDFIKSDFSRYKKRYPRNLGEVLWACMRIPCFHYTFWMRLGGVKGVLYPFAKIARKHLSRKYGLQIDSSTHIGKGLYLGHGYIIVNPTAIIGENVNLSQFTTIGSNHGSAAVIGDNVYIGPNVCLVENVHIGDNAKIGAGAVVVKDVPAYATAVGVPAHNIIK